MRSFRFRPIAVIAIALLLMTFALGWNDVSAANFVVTNGQANGPGSLRQAVLDANANNNPGVQDTITFSGVTAINQEDLDPLFSTGDITITESVAIMGPGRNLLTIDGRYAWINHGIVNGGFPDSPTSIITTSSGNLFEVGVSGADNSGLRVKISGMKVTRTAGLVDAWNGAEVEILDVAAIENAFPIINGQAMVAVRIGKLTIQDSTLSGSQAHS